MDTIEFVCECNDRDCLKKIELSMATAVEIIQSGYVTIVDGCQTGPGATDILVEKRDGYSLYKEAQLEG